MGKCTQDEDLYRPVYKEGTHLAPSKGIEGAVRGSLLDNERNQIAGQAEWIKVDESEYGYDESYNFHEFAQTKELSPEDQELVQLLGAAIAAGTVWVLSEVVAPRVKFWWQEKAAPVVREKWRAVKRKNSKRNLKEKSVQISEVADTTESVSGMISQELDNAYEKYIYDMTSEEAKRELMDIFILSVILTSKIRKLSYARITKYGDTTGEHIEGQEIIQKLSSPEYIASINQILENNPLLLKEKLATLSEILGCRIVIDGQYVPIEGARIREDMMGNESNLWKRIREF